MRPVKLLSAIAGVLIVIVGFVMTLGGALVLAVADDDGRVTVGPLRVTTDAVALVGEDIDLELGDRLADGHTSIEWDAIATSVDVASRNGKDVFIGVAERAAVDDYLAGVAVERVSLFDGDARSSGIAGAGEIEPPAEQPFWMAAAVDGVLEWDAAAGDWAIVVLNADGSPGVDVAVTGSASIPFLDVIGVAVLVTGLLALGFGGFLTYMGVREVRPRRIASSHPGAPAPVS